MLQQVSPCLVLRELPCSDYRLQAILDENCHQVSVNVNNHSAKHIHDTGNFAVEDHHQPQCIARFCVVSHMICITQLVSIACSCSNLCL